MNACVRLDVDVQVVQQENSFSDTNRSTIILATSVDHAINLVSGTGGFENQYLSSVFLQMLTDVCSTFFFRVRRTQASIDGGHRQPASYLYWYVLLDSRCACALCTCTGLNNMHVDIGNTESNLGISAQHLHMVRE